MGFFGCNFIDYNNFSSPRDKISASKLFCEFLSISCCFAKGKFVVISILVPKIIAERRCVIYGGDSALSGPDRASAASEVTVECFLSGGLPAFDVVGLPDAAVRESRERVRAAVKACGARLPRSAASP